MTDRELLELAAKAAGIGPLSWVEPDGTKIITNLRWNPLTDDGDALRLAVKIGMEINTNSNEARVVGSVNTHGQVGERDPYAATRRAIVRAAAEIGRQVRLPQDATPA